MTAMIAPRTVVPAAGAVSVGFFWFARHEARLAIRDVTALLSGGRRTLRLPFAVAWILFAILLLHAVAYAILSAVDLSDSGTPVARLMLTGAVFLSWMLLLAQAMESATRALYGRADLDLVLSSPAPARGLFAIRIGVSALTTATMALVIVTPFVVVAVALDGWRWLSAIGLVIAMALSAAAAGVAMTLGLFAMIGPKRTRTIAQVVAAVFGAGFVIGAQAVGILAYGDISRFAVFRSPELLAAMPGEDSPLWWPARAAAGDLAVLLLLGAVAAALFVAAVSHAADRFSGYALSTSGALPDATRREGRARFVTRGAVATLRAKEMRLLLRDPWLISQSLMQILYLVPPGLMLWRAYGDDADAIVTLVPVLVMAAGQLAGGLAWLTISGEDAPDLVATAPVTGFDLVRAKAEAVVLSVAMPLLPLILAVAVAAPRAGLIALAGVAIATAAATVIQFLFRATARRSQFRRRQTASRVSTFTEAFSSIGWAATAGLAAAGSAAWPVAAVASLLVLAIAAALAPRRDQA